MGVSFFMKIAIVSNSDAFFPLAYALLGQRLPVSLFYSPGEEEYTNQKVAAFTQQAGIVVTEERHPDKDPYHWLLQGGFGACFIIGYKHLVQLDRLKDCPTPLFNIHYGPLPAYRGPIPLFWQLKRGENKLGLCIHRLSQKFDDGPVVWLKETDNLPHYNYKSVSQLFNQLCVEGVFYILQLMLNRLPLPVVKRDGVTAAYQKKPGLSEVMISWQQMGAAEICNLIRAGNPWNKGAITFFKGQEVKLMDTLMVAEAAHPAEPGTIIDDEGQLHISCGDGVSLQVNMLFYNDFFLPAYQCRQWGFVKGQKFG